MARHEFYESLYEYVWQNLEALLGTAATLDLLASSSKALRERYPFLLRAGLVVTRAGARAAWGMRSPESDVSRCTPVANDFCKGVHTVVREVGGDTLAQFLAAATEQRRDALERANGSQRRPPTKPGYSPHHLKR